MAETSRSFLETVGGVITIGGVVAGLTAYCVSLQFGLNQASREIERLDKQLSSISSTQAASQQGMRGPKGDTGDVGPQGPRGPAGEPGPAVDRGEIAAMIASLVPARASAGQRLTNTYSAAEPSSTDTGCRLNKEFADLRTFSIRKGIEVCDATGRVLAIVDKVTTDGFPDYIGVNFKVPGGKDVFCWKEATSCQVPWLPGKAFYIERLSQDVEGGVAVLRRKG